MWDWIYRLLFLIFVGFCFRVAISISRKSVTDVFINTFTVFTGSVILTGFVLSRLYLTANTTAWAISVFIPGFVLYLIGSRFWKDEQSDFSFISLIGNRLQASWSWFTALSVWLKIVFGVMTLSVILVSVTNLILLLFTVPNEWDSMTGHLVRVMYFIERGTMAPFYGTNWNIDTYPRSVCGIQIYSFLITGKFENAFKFIDYYSYWIGVFTAYGIARSISRNTTAALFCGLTFALLPNVLLQSITTDSDIVLMAYVSCLVYYLFSYHETQQRNYLYLAGLMVGIGLGHKITLVLQAPSLFLVAVYAFAFEVPNVRQSLIRFKYFLLAGIIGVILFTLPSGYISNLERYHHPIGPPTATRHQSVERAGGILSPNLYEQGTRNVLRYAFDFYNMDGLRNIPAVENGPNIWMRKPFIWLEGKAHARLVEETNFTIFPFSYQRRHIWTNILPYWGTIGFAMIWPLLFLVVLGVIRSKPLVFLAGAVILHTLALSYSAPYDQFKGRYFISTAVYAVPFLTLLFTRRYSVIKPGSLLLKAYFFLIALITCASGILIVYMNERCPPISLHGEPSAFHKSRIDMMTFSREDMTAAYKKFDALVPAHATVALGDINDDFEYPLFGEHLTRKLIPINPFERGLQPIPKEADYLFFSSNVIKPQPGDIRLGTDTTSATKAKMITPAEDYWLRKLK
ncbi:MAG: glycosyltransferase family 39 protein [Siphonobacter sp.]